MPEAENCRLFFNPRATRFVVSHGCALLLAWALPVLATAQQSPQPSLRAGATLPDAPAPGVEESSPETAGTATISGTVLDSQGAVIQGATVKLSRGPSGPVRTTQSGADGQFSFTALPEGTYRLIITGPGMSTYVSPDISLRAGEARIAPPTTLSIEAASASVTVTADKNQLAEEQVQIAIEQRVFGVIPNFYSSYDWNASPMGAKQKFKLSLRSMFDPVSFATVAGVAGAEQYRNIFPAYGSGLEGYGKRYGAAFANHVSGQIFSRAIYPSLFHEDPRYFYKGKGSIRSRALYAISRAVIARGDDGSWKPNYSAVLGNFTAGAISNLYYPEADRGASLVFYNGLAETGADAVGNLIREFLLKGITSHAPKGENAP